MVRTMFSPRCWATSSTRRLAVVVGFERREDRRQLAFERDVDDGADDLRDPADEIAVVGAEAVVAAAAAFLLRGLAGAAVAMFCFLAS